MRRLLTISLGLLAVIATAAGVWYLNHRQVAVQAYRLPAALKSQTNFAVYLPITTTNLQLDTNSVKVSQIEGETVLNFVLTLNGQTITMSEQAYPDALIYDKFTNSLGPDTEVGTDLGKLTVGHPKDAHGQQVAGMRVSDTLILGRPAQDLTSDQWLTIMNSLELAK